MNDKLVAYKLNFRHPGRINRQIWICAIAIFLGMLSVRPAYSQIDYNYGRNTSGWRLGAGAGITQLTSRYNQNPWIGCFIGTLDYEVNPYFSMGIEGQIGTLQGIDNNTPHTQYYYASTNDYKSINFNLKFGLGLVSDMKPINKFQDAVKRTYVGLAGGVMKSIIGLSRDTTVGIYYKDIDTYHYSPVLSFNLGTFIDIGKVFGYDRIEINPNYQITYIDSPYGDGFKFSADSKLKTFYNMLSLTVKLKL